MRDDISIIKDSDMYIFSEKIHLPPSLWFEVSDTGFAVGSTTASINCFF